MQLVHNVDEVDLIRHLNLILNHVTEFIIKLFCEVRVTFSVDNIVDAAIGHQLGLALRLILTNILLALLVDGLLMKHVIGAIFVSGAH